ncbi:MAG: glycosyltransferase [Planctomycetota bacterium]
MQFILVAVGSIGDVFPLLEISRQLVRRGHRVRVIANPWYEHHVEKTGAELVPAGSRDDQEKMLAHPDLWHPRKGWPLWLSLGALPIMRQSFEFIEQNNVPGETVVAGSWGALGAIIAREKLGVPLATLHLEPDKFRTAYQSPVMPAHMMLHPSSPPWLKRFQYALADWLVIDRVFEPVNQFRRELGLPPVRHFLDQWIHSPDLTVGLFPDWWGPRQPDWPDATFLAGFPVAAEDPSAELPSDVAAFVDEGEPPLVFSPGGVNRQAKRFFETAVDSCRQLSARAIFLTGYPDQLPDPLPAGIRHFKFVPFGPLLKRAAAVIHHGGIGTTAMCLKAAVPQVAVPNLHINRDTATRLARSGAGGMIRPQSLNTTSLGTALDELLKASAVRNRCGEIASLMQGVDAVSATCDRMESLPATVQQNS